MNGLPPSPFLSAAMGSAEAAPAESSGEGHCSAGGRSIPIDYEKLFDAITEDPPPLFLRKPSQAFMRALFELSR